MPAIIFGVNDLPYSHTENLGTVKKGKTKGRVIISTTGEVADILEAKYHVMEEFWKLHSTQVVEALSESIVGSFESMVQGAPAAGLNVFASGESEVTAMFKDYLSNAEIENTGTPGVPTKASIKRRSGGKSLRKKSAGTGPSFVDSGLYQSSFAMRVEK